MPARRDSIASAAPNLQQRLDLWNRNNTIVVNRARFSRLVSTLERSKGNGAGHRGGARTHRLPIGNTMENNRRRDNKLTR